MFSFLKGNILIQAICSKYLKMQNLKELSHRIKNIKSIQKTTKVMQMISAAKLRRSGQQLINSRLYLSKIYSTLSRLMLELSENDCQTTFKTQKNSHLLILIASDRGLCGNFNSSIIKLTKSYIDRLPEDKKEVDIVIFGKKAYDMIKNQSKNIIRVFNCNKITFSHLQSLIDQVPNFYYYNTIEVFYNKFYNTFTQKSLRQILLPWGSDSSLIDNSVIQDQNSCYEYEVDKEFLLDFLMKNYIISSLYSGLLESVTSEHSARMIAMESANRNTKEMLNKLILTYNRSRQAAITTDLIEVIGGAEALS